MNDEFNFDNEIIEISSDPQEVAVDFEEKTEPTTGKEKKKKEKKDNIFKRFSNWFKELDKKKKIIFISVSSLVFLLIVGLVVYLILSNKKDEVKEDVVFESENYKYDNGTLIFLDNDKEIGKYECTIKDKDKCFVAYLDNEKDTFDHPTNVDKDDKTIDKRSQIYFKKYVFINDDNKVILYNIKDKKNEEKLTSVKAYDTEENYVVVSDKDKKFGVILFKDDSYDYQINAYYDYLGIVDTKDLLLVSKTGEKERIIDINNKQLSKEFNASIKSANKSYISAVSNGKKYNLYSYNYEELLSGYDYISFHDEYIGLVKDSKLYFVDENLNKMNEEGIKLTSNNYNLVNKYNKSNKLVSSDVSYKVTINKDNLSVDFGEEENIVINKYEGAVSANYPYINYFDGYLYFYSDQEKTESIGKYECKNKNKLTSPGDSLSNCTLYGNADGVTGIYNNNFVFITDNSSMSNSKTVSVYSINEKKTKVTYSELSTINKAYVSNNIKSYYTDNMYIMAKNTKGNYGVVKITSSDVEKVLSFNFKNITNKNDYYLLESSDSKFSIVDKDFKELVPTQDYIDVVGDYAVAIKDNKLNLYLYKSTTSPILTNSLAITSKDYKNAYKITIGTSIVITIDGKNYSYKLDGTKIDDVEPVTSEPGE